MVDPVLSTIAQGYSNSGFVADALFPVISVSKLKGKFPVFGKEAFIIRNTNRATGADSNRIPLSDLSLISFETQERDIEMAVDYLEEEESPDFFRIEQRVTKELMDLIMLGREKQAADIVQNLSTYDDDQKLVLSSVSAWNNYSLDVDPIQHIKQGMRAVRAKIGRYPNTLVMGESAWQALIDHPKVVDKIKYLRGVQLTLPMLSEIVEVPEIKIGQSVFSSDGETFEDVWRDNAVLAYVDKNEKAVRSEFNPSFGYTFQREGKPEIDSYSENGGKKKIIRATDNYCLRVTSTDAAFLISNTNS
jgi:hypothetical protein